MKNTLQNMMNNTVERYVVLVSPAVHWNTGNIGRTCLEVGAFLHGYKKKFLPVIKNFPVVIK
jgi:hypothetical protein